MIVYLVMAGEYEEKHADSIWSTRALAEARKTEIERQYGRWKTPRMQFTRRWSPNLPPEAECVADGGWIEEYDIDVIGDRATNALRAAGAPA